MRVDEAIYRIVGKRLFSARRGGFLRPATAELGMTAFVRFGTRRGRVFCPCRLRRRVRAKSKNSRRCEETRSGGLTKQSIELSAKDYSAHGAAGSFVPPQRNSE